MNNLVLVIFCALFAVTYSYEFNSTLLAGKVLHPDIQRYREPKNYFVTLNRGNVVFAVGILLTNSAVMTAAHSIHNLPQPGYGGVFFKAELYSTRYILNIDYVIYDSYKNSNLRERGIDFAVLHMLGSVLEYVNHIGMPTEPVNEITLVHLEVWETSTNPSKNHRTGYHKTSKLLLVLTMSADYCEEKLGGRIDDDLLCAKIADHGGEISQRLFTVADGAPLTDGNNLIGITSYIRQNLSPPLIVFTRISPYAGFIQHEIHEDSDTNGRSSNSNSYRSTECSDND